MTAAASRVHLPRRTITTDCKLETAFRYIVGQELIGAHDASVDARAVAQIYVHHAKDYRDYLARGIMRARQLDEMRHIRS